MIVRIIKIAGKIIATITIIIPLIKGIVKIWSADPPAGM